MTVLESRHPLAFIGDTNGSKVSGTRSGYAAEAGRDGVTWNRAGVVMVALGAETSAASEPTIELIARRTKAEACFMGSPLIRTLSFHTTLDQVDIPAKVSQLFTMLPPANAIGPKRAASAVRLRPRVGRPSSQLFDMYMRPLLLAPGEIIPLGT